MKKRTFCVYVYYVKDMPIYVGKGKKQRPWVHLRRSHNAGLAQFITWAKEEGIHVAPEIVFYTEEEFEAFAYEHTLIMQYGRIDLETGTLFNRNNGVFQRNLVLNGGVLVDRRNGTFRRKLSFKENEYVVKLNDKRVLSPPRSVNGVKTRGLRIWERDHLLRTWRFENRSALRMLKQAQREVGYNSTKWKRAEEERVKLVTEQRERQRQARLGVG